MSSLSREIPEAAFSILSRRVTSIGKGSVIVVDEGMESSLDRQPHSPVVELLGLPATLDIDLLDMRPRQATGNAATALRWPLI
jgi:hypothetical protein